MLLLNKPVDLRKQFDILAHESLGGVRLLLLVLGEGFSLMLYLFLKYVSLLFEYLDLRVTGIIYTFIEHVNFVQTDAGSFQLIKVSNMS